MLKPNYVWISHEHGDHFDTEYLKKVDKSAKVIIGDFISQTLRKELRALGFSKIIEMSNFQVFKLSSELSISMLLEKPIITEHSSILCMIKKGSHVY